MQKEIKMKENLIIVGAGISGLYTTFLLHEKYNITILEARPRIGGRILSKDSVDLGPSWVWPHHKNILKLINDFDLELIEQYTSGHALYDEKNSTQRFKNPSSAPSFRVQGGMQKIVDTLQQKLKDIENINIKLEVTVESVEYRNEKVYLKTKEEIYVTNKIIFAIPPRLITQNIEFIPALELKTKDKLNNITTWMAHTAKAVITFEQNFWKQKGLSGFAFQI